MLVYHGSSTEVKQPNLSFSDTNTDFGLGFYVTTDPLMAERWAANKKDSVVSVYEFDIDGLNVKSFGVTREWLLYICKNRVPDRFRSVTEQDADKFPVIIGPTADDKMFKMLNRFFDDEISEDVAVTCLSAVRIGEQIAIKDQNILDSRLRFVKSYSLTSEAKELRIAESKLDREFVNNAIDSFVKGKINKEEFREAVGNLPSSNIGGINNGR